MLRDPSWVKSRIAARILLRRHNGRLASRDYRLADWLSHDPGVTDRLIRQALASICAQKGFSADQYHAIVHATLASGA
jgi:hypothetical protein